MSRSSQLKIGPLAIGLAMFSMFFGAGNVIFPLVVGQYAGSQNWQAILGLILTAVVMPFAGVYAMILYEGNYHRFFNRLGKVPGFLIALAILLLLGPFGSIPRCVALSYSSVKALTPISSVVFSAIACLVVFIFTLERNRILDLLGKILTPVLLGTLFFIIVKGLLTPSQSTLVVNESESLFWYGLKEGYKTMDLMAAFFFSSTIVALVKKSDGKAYTKNLAIHASLIGAGLLSLVYIGFFYVASYHGEALDIVAKDEILSGLALKIAGPSLGLVASVAISLACLTTAIALSAVFTDYVRHEILGDRYRYGWVLAGTMLTTFFVSTYEFRGISAFLEPILEICYPFLIVLTVVNIYLAKREKKNRATEEIK